MHIQTFATSAYSIGGGRGGAGAEAQTQENRLLLLWELGKSMYRNKTAAALLGRQRSSTQPHRRVSVFVFKPTFQVADGQRVQCRYTTADTLGWLFGVHEIADRRAQCNNVTMATTTWVRIKQHQTAEGRQHSACCHWFRHTNVYEVKYATLPTQEQQKNNNKKYNNNKCRATTMPITTEAPRNATFSCWSHYLLLAV